MGGEVTGGEDTGTHTVNRHPGGSDGGIGVADDGTHTSYRQGGGTDDGQGLCVGVG